MTRAEAIEYWEQFNAEIDDLYDACSDADRDVLVKQREIVEYTISALRQQETVTNRNGLNQPLTLDELRQMDGEPAWFVSLRDGFASWGIVRVVEMSKVWFIAVAGAERAFGDLDGYGKTWTAYRQKPEEGTV